MNVNPQDRQETAYEPLLHWNDSALALVEDKVSRAIDQWRHAWSPAPGGGAQAAAWIGEPHGRPCVALRLHADPSLDAAGAWLVCEQVAADGAVPRAEQLVGPRLYGSDAGVEPDSIAAEFCREALAAFVTALRSALMLDGGTGTGFDPAAVAGTLPAAAFRAWAGGVRIALPHFDTVALYLTGPAVARLDPPRAAPLPTSGAPLTALTAAAAQADAVLAARLHPVELTLGAIGSLRVGDVVVLPHALERPLDVVTADGAVLCEAYLGRVGAHRSLELLPRHAPAAGT